jgi:hypothetical protein
VLVELKNLSGQGNYGDRAMTKAKSYKSNIKAAIRELVSDLHKVGIIDKQTMLGATVAEGGLF